MRVIDTVVVHCSYTKVGQDIGAEEIDLWHKDRGWRCIGYHYVIRRDGILEVGRPVEKIGAHALKHNIRSIGICLVGGMGEDGEPDCNFTSAQYETLAELVDELVVEFDIEAVLGHRDLPTTNKACPCFDVKGFLQW